MDKRTFLKKSAVLGLGGVITSSSVTGKVIGSTGFFNRDIEGDDRFSLPELDYPYDALEPFIDARTMEIHHSKHHAGYTSKFNAAVKGTELADMKVKDMFKNVSEYPVAVRNNGGGYFNHKLYWKFMSPKGGGQPQGDLMDAINKFFVSFENFKDKFSTAAATQFGSGWAWLVVSDNKLVVTSTPNQDNPLMDIAGVKGEPILNIDVWEHAYYLKYQNRRTDYIAAFWNVINWDYVGERFKKAM